MVSSRPDLPIAAQAIAAAVLEVLASKQWEKLRGDDYERSWLLTRSVCDSLYLAGVNRVPSGVAVQQALDRWRRNEQLVAEFDGTNYSQLARRHGVSVRTARRVIEQARRQAMVPLP